MFYALVCHISSHLFVAPCMHLLHYDDDAFTNVVAY